MARPFCIAKVIIELKPRMAILCYIGSGTVASSSMGPQVGFLPLVNIGRSRGKLDSNVVRLAFVWKEKD